MKRVFSKSDGINSKLYVAMDDVNKEKEQSSTGSTRRNFLEKASGIAMAAGLVGGYGGLAVMAGRFLYPRKSEGGLWQYVIETEHLEVGTSIRYMGPSGETINVARQANNGTVDDFVALSSTCPHLGCQVRWEAQNDRFFCPCHNGSFDLSGRATEGPPAEAGQSLPTYPLKMEGGLLFIQVPPPQFADAQGEVKGLNEENRGPGKDQRLAARSPRTQRSKNG